MGGGAGKDGGHRPVGVVCPLGASPVLSAPFPWVAYLSEVVLFARVQGTSSPGRRCMLCGHSRCHWHPLATGSTRSHGGFERLPPPPAANQQVPPGGFHLQFPGHLHAL